MLVNAVLTRGFADVVQDLGAIGDRLLLRPGAEAVSVGVHVRVRADAGIAEKVPGAPAGDTGLKDGVAHPRAARLQMAGRADTGQPGTHDQDVEVFRRDGRAACPNPGDVFGILSWLGHAWDLSCDT